VYDVRSSWVVDEVVRKGGGVPVRERVGHAFMKATLRKRNAPFGGELSCHYYFRDNFFTDSGAIAMITMLNVLGEAEKPLSELIAPLKRYFASGELDFPVKDKEAKLHEVAQRFSDARTQYKDGITAEYRDWWFNLRPSNTQALMRLNLEAKTPELLSEKKGLLTQLLQK
jgi:phosphomannomutase